MSDWITLAAQHVEPYVAASIMGTRTREAKCRLAAARNILAIREVNENARRAEQAARDARLVPDAVCDFLGATDFDPLVQRKKSLLCRMILGERV